MKKPVQIFSYSIVNASSKKAVIHIDGDIVDASTQAVIKAIFGDTTTTSYKSFRNEIEKLDVEEYDVIINSSGGHVGDALAIHDMLLDLQNKGKTVNTIGRGIVASAATLLLLAGKNPEMSANSWFMMHEVRGGAYGSVTEIENYASTMRKFNDKIRDVYVNKSNQKKEEVENLMSKDTWLTAQEAKEKGFINIISGDAAFENKLDAEEWPFEDTTALVAYNNSVKPPSQQITNFEDMKKFLENWGKEIKNLITGTKPAADATNETIVNSIAEAVGSSFTNMASQFETEINNHVTNFLNTEAGQQALTNFLKSEAGQKVIADSQVIKDLEQDVTNKLGERTVDISNESTTKVVGGFAD